MGKPAADHGRSSPAIAARDGLWTYVDLERASRDVALQLLDGLDDLGEARVAYLQAPGGAHVALQLGIWQAGGIAVPLAASQPPPELEYIVRDAAAAHVIAGSAASPLRAIAASAGSRFHVTGDLLTASREHDRSLPVISPGRRALIVYTSGTTGRPKGVVSTHRNITAQTGALIEAWGWTSRDRILHVLPLNHIHGIINALHTPLAAGATCEFIDFDAAAVWDRLASGDITVFTGVPTIYRRLIDRWQAASAAQRHAWSEGIRQLRLMMCGSAALPVSLLEQWREISGHVLLERYGMTETGMILSNPLNGARQPGHVGLPLPGVHVRLLAEDGSDVADGTAGEIHVKGENVFLEYWRRPEETRDAYVDGWFRTGDIAVRDEGGYRILGRNSVDIIKTGGYKVSALEIEEVLRLHPAIAECAVVGVEDDVWGERISAVVELRKGERLSIEELQQWAKTQLAPYKLPRTLRAVDALPRNALGKVVKPQLAAILNGSESPPRRTG